MTLVSRTTKISQENADKQTLDYHLVKALSRTPFSNERSLFIDASSYLEAKNIVMLPGEIKRYAQGYMLIPSCEIKGVPALRVGKQIYYDKFWKLVKQTIPQRDCRSYVGLSANQLDVVTSLCATATVVEKDKTRYCELVNLNHNLVLVGRDKLDVVKDDLFDYINNSRKSFNVFDLDLMCHIPEEEVLTQWTKTIWESSACRKPIVLGLVNSVGRRITIQKHRERTNQLTNLLEKYFVVGLAEEFSYCDRRVPMYCSLYQLR